MTAFQLEPHAQGVLPSQWIRKAIDAGVISSAEFKIPDSNIQPASLDLQLGEKAYRLRCSFLPGAASVEERLADFAMGAVDLSSGGILERNRPYLIPLVEELSLPETLRAKANPKSSTGRLDIFTRVITDGSYRFDEIRPGYNGKLYLEVFSRSFTILLKRQTSLNQLRLIAGNPAIGDAQILERHRSDPLLLIDSEPIDPQKVELTNGLFLSLDFEREDIGYRAKKNSSLLDLSKVGAHAIEDFWEPLPRERKGGVVLEPEEFYLLLSKEQVRIPPDLAAEMTAYDPTSGELRTHYAGFFDPGFGHDPSGAKHGSKAALEVRAHDVPFIVETHQWVCKLGFEKMLEPPTILYGTDIGSNYQGQGITVSKHFRR
ncbi:MAG: 2'-deoxycytidine 5'-triphosphate deaminase [Actinomycetota bacterium]